MNNTQTAKKLNKRLPNDLETSEDPTLHKASPSSDTLAKTVKIFLTFEVLKFRVLALWVG